MGEHGGTSGQGALELCDFCGAVEADGAAYALVLDSSAIDAYDAIFDGTRLISACTDDHLRRLVEQSQQRPFVYAELWAGKVLRAVTTCRSQPVDDTALVALTGLTVEQIHAGIDWHHERARAFRKPEDETPR